MKIKSVLSLGLIAATAITLSGCGAEDEGIVFWHTMGKDNMATLDTMIVEFNKIYPDIKITHSAQGGFDDLQVKVNTALAGNNQPNLAYAYPDHVASYLTSGKVVSLDQFIDSTELTGNPNDEAEILGFTAAEKEDFVPGYWNEGKVYDTAGTMYSFPFSKSTEVMFYNKTAFDANGWSVPETWDEMWDLCAEIKEFDNTLTPLGYDSEDNMFITLLEQYNLPYTSVVEGQNYLFNTDNVKSLMTEMQDYYKAGYFTTKGNSNNEYTSTQFTSQKLMMTIGSTGGAKYNMPSIDGNTGEAAFDYAIAAIPQANVDNGKVIQQGPSLVMFDDGEEINEDVWKFIKFITNTENSAAYSMSTGYFPVRYSSMELDTFEKFLLEDTITSETLRAAQTQMEMFYTSPAFNGSSAARIQAGKILVNICLGEVSVNKAFEDAMAELNK